MTLPTLNAVFNTIAAALLIGGYLAIKRKAKERHKAFMLAALTSSVLFLTSYVIHHARVGSVPYAHHDWTRIVYFVILIPHVIHAALMGPFIVIAVVHALRGRFEKHRRIVRWIWPVWMFVSVSGDVIYVMLYHL